MIFPLTPTNLGCWYHIFWIHKCITQITAVSDTGALSPCVPSAALHAQGRAPGWEKARRRAPATRLPWLWRTSCSGRATANLSPLRYVSRWPHRSLTKHKVKAAKGHLRHALQNDAASRLAARFRGRQIISVEFCDLRLKQHHGLLLLWSVLHKKLESGWWWEGRCHFFFKSGFLIMDVFLPKSIAGLLKRWSFLWLTEQRPTQMITTLHSLKISDQPACPCCALGLATEIDRRFFVPSFVPVLLSWARTSKINYNNHSIIVTESNGLSPETLSVCLYTALVLLMYYSGWWQFNKTIHFHKVRHQTNLVCCFFCLLAASTSSFDFCLICFSSIDTFYWRLLVHPAWLSLISLVDSGAVVQPTQLTRGIYSPGRKDNRICDWPAVIGL